LLLLIVTLNKYSCPVHTMKAFTESRSIALHILYLSASWRWGVNTTPKYDKFTPVSAKEAIGWAPELVWTLSRTGKSVPFQNVKPILSRPQASQKVRCWGFGVSVLALQSYHSLW